MKALYLLAFLLALGLIFSMLERESILVGDSIVKDPPLVFAHPLACDAIVAQRGAGEPFVSRCYIRGQR